MRQFGLGGNQVLVSIDGTLADSRAKVAAIVQSEHPEIILPRHPDRHLHIEEYFHSSRRAAILGIIARRGFFTELPTIEHALAGWQRIKDAGYDPLACDEPLKDSKVSATGKVAWVRRNIGREAAIEAVITPDLWQLDGFALIDHHPVIKNSQHAPWTHILLDRPYNRHVPTRFRLRGWLDPQLPKLLAEARQRYLKRFPRQTAS